MLDGLRRENGPVFWVDAGDLLFPRGASPPDERARSRASFLIETLAGMGLDAWAPSPADLRLGIRRLSQEAQRAGLVLLASNVEWPGEPPVPWKSHLVLERRGWRLGFVGLLGDSTDGSWKTKPARLALEQAQQKLQGQVDLVVVLSNRGVSADEELAGSVPGLRLILSAGEERMILEPRRIEGCWILEPYRRGQYLGVITLARPAGSQLGVIDLQYQLQPLSAEAGDRPDVAERVRIQLAREAGLVTLP